MLAFRRRARRYGGTSRLGLIVAPKLFIGGKESLWNHSPQPTVNNFAPPKKMTVNNSTFTRVIRVNPPGPENEYLGLNARRFHEDFRPGPGPSMPRNSPSLRAAEKMTVNNPTFTRIMPVNTPGPEDEYLGLNARRFQEDFRSGPGALMQRNSQSLSPARHTGRDELSIRTSIHQGPRVQPNESH